MIFDVMRFAVHDGPGIRTTVFLKGCPMKCAWCHNPEAIPAEPMLAFTAHLCTKCGACVEACRKEAHRIGDGRHEIDRRRCEICGACVEQCYAVALEITGARRTAAEVIEEVLQDRLFYKNSGGGMTLSGGEPLTQAAFARALLRLARENGIHTALDTAGFASWDTLEKTAELADLILYDLKHTHNPQHLACTGVSNEHILENLRRLDETGRPIWIRIPLVVGYNDSDESFRAFGEFLQELHHVKRIEVLRYNRLAESKYERIGADYPLRGLPTPDWEHAQSRCRILAQYGLPQIVCR
jgi:pyruvate formate lyase activating enzyme